MQPSANTATAIIKYFLSILVEILSVNILFSECALTTAYTDKRKSFTKNLQKICQWIL